MSKSFVEKYEQMLIEDPASTVFVELARALLDRGDHERAMKVCEAGLAHHPQSVVGRVLWGKALINGGRAAEAMQQFDLAIAVEKDNPHAYNLISEVLLRKGLYRSALPLLRKAMALQPGDLRVKQWHDQTKAALAGGAAPVLYDSTTVDALSLATAPATVGASESVTGLIPLPVAATTSPAARATSTSRPTLPAVPSPPDPMPVEKATSTSHPSLQVVPAVAPLAPVPAAKATSTSNPTLPAVTSTSQPALPVVPPSAPRPGATRTSQRALAPVESAPPTGLDDVFAAFNGPPSDPDSQPTVVTEAYTPTAPPVPTVEVPAAGAPTERPTVEIPVAAGGQPPPPPAPSSPAGRTSRTDEIPAVVAPPPPPAPSPLEAPDPFAALMGGSEGPDTFRGLTSTFNALTGSEGSPPQSNSVAPPMPEASIIPAADLLLPPAPRGPRMLEDIASAQNEIPTSELRLPAAVAAGLLPAEPRPSSPRSSGLLDEIPEELPDAPHAHGAAAPEATAHHAETVAREYEQELRQKLEAHKQQKTFWQKHGLQVAAAAVVAVIAIGLGSSFVYTRVKNKGESLDSAVGKGLAAVTADTREQYAVALQAFDQALSMDDSSSDAWAWKGYANAILFAEHGGDPKNAQAAKDAFTHAHAREKRADLALVSDYLVADPASRATSRQELLGSPLETTIVAAQQGRVLLADKKPDEALKHLQRAVELDGKNLRALLSLGEYYLSFEDYENAFTVLSGPAATLSKFHPERVMALAEARLQLGRELPEALAELEGLPKTAQVPKRFEARYALALGRALAANGKADEAQRTLTQGLAAHPEAAFDFQMALGFAHRAHGEMERAQTAFEAAVKLDPKDEAAREGLGRALLARSREREVLDRLKPEKDARKIALVRGIAASRLGDWKKSRQELQATQVGGKYPAEAVVYLSLADAAEEKDATRAIEMLEKLLTQARRNKATVQVALARVYMQKSQVDKARALLEEAAKDPQDYEGNALLGELLLGLGVGDEVVLEPIARAVERNGSHAPARHQQVRILLALGRTAEAAKSVDAWVADNPSLDLAWRDAAQVYLQAGRLKDAEVAVTKGVRADSDDVEAFKLKARVLFARGDAKNAFAALERANKLNAKDPGTFCEIGFAFIRQGNPDMGLKAFEAAVREDPRSFCGRVGPHHAFPLAHGGRPSPHDQLVKLVQEAKGAWDKAAAQSALARVMLKEGNARDALSTAEEAAAAEPAHPWVQFALGEALRASKDDARALEAYRLAAELDGSWTGAHFAYAEALQKAGGANLPKAVQEYDLVASLSQNDGEAARAAAAAKALRKQLK